jgi:hypothetical protein
MPPRRGFSLVLFILLVLVLGGLELAGRPAGAQTAPGTWSSQAPYPIPILDQAVAVQGTALYSFSGVSNDALTANAYKYDGSAWTAIAPLPASREGASGVSDGTYIYILGGTDSTGVQNTLYRYDPATNTYLARAAFSTPTFAQAVAYLDGKIYRISGCTTPCSATTNTVEAYTISTNSWATVAPYPNPQGFVMAVASGGYLYTAGGGDGKTRKTYRYDPATKTWDDAAITDLPANRWGAASGLLNGRWLLAGGYIGTTEFTTSTLAWDPATNTWATLPALPQARSRTGGGTLGSASYALGGRSTHDFAGTTDTQQYLESVVSTPTATSTRTATATLAATGTATPTPTATPPANSCTTCGAYIPSVAESCNADGTVHWAAVVRNNDTSCALVSPWQVELQVQRSYGDYVTVQTLTGDPTTFPTGDTAIEGDLAAYSFPADTTGIQVRFVLTGAVCNGVDGLSGGQDACAVAAGTPTPTPPPSTPTLTPTAMPCTTCGAYIPSVTESCNTDGTVHWSAVVRNNDTSCALVSPWQVELQVQRNYGDFEIVQTITGGPTTFPSGDTALSGDMSSYSFPADTTASQIRFVLTGTVCNNTDGLSGAHGTCP